MHTREGTPGRKPNGCELSFAAIFSKLWSHKLFNHYTWNIRDWAGSLLRTPPRGKIKSLQLQTKKSTLWAMPRRAPWLCPSVLESFQDFLFELDMKPCMHLLEISIFSLNNVTIRLTKIMNNLLKHLKILIFKVIFQCWKLVESFRNFFLWRILD